MKPNLVFDYIQESRDYWNDEYVYRWFKNGSNGREQVHELRLTLQGLALHPGTVLCPACLCWRGEIVWMQPNVFVPDAGMSLPVCPECCGADLRSLYPEKWRPPVPCSCGSVPHEKGCYMYNKFCEKETP